MTSDLTAAEVVRLMPTRQLLERLYTLQIEADSGENSPEHYLDIVAANQLISKELRSRGVTDLQILYAVLEGKFD